MKKKKYPAMLFMEKHGTQKAPWWTTEEEPEQHANPNKTVEVAVYEYTGTMVVTCNTSVKGGSKPKKKK